MSDIKIALAGNPNVGKSTVFNALTGGRRHTGNWSGKTVDAACGVYSDADGTVTFIDLPGTYSLDSASPEEKIARDYIAAGEADTVVIVCDACCLARNLILAMQIKAITGRAALCVNLLDEAKKRGITVNTQKLSEMLGMPVVGTSAARGEGLDEMIKVCRRTAKLHSEPSQRQDAESCAFRAREIAEKCTSESAESATQRFRRLDRILTGRLTGIPVMLAMLFLILWITVVGANYPSELISRGLFAVGEALRSVLCAVRLPAPLIGALVDGVYMTTAWVVGVMLPPMAIFFPLFTVLEDLGYLPRVAFNLDGAFRMCGSCGKQSLTMCLHKKGVPGADCAYKGITEVLL